MRDVCVVVAEEVQHREVERAIRDAGGDLVETVALFDLYRGTQVGPGRKSMAYTVRFRSQTETWTDDRVDGIMDPIRMRLSEALSATFRD